MKNQTERGLLVVKVGTNTLMETKDGQQALDWASFSRIGKQIGELCSEGYGVVLVSSGAIAAGAVETGTKLTDDLAMVERQRLAGIGWHSVVEAWRHTIVSQKIGSMLLTRHELAASEDTRKEALGTIDCHIRHGDTVVINENDAIAHNEISFGDNDILSGVLALQLCRTGLYGNVRLVLLTDRDGLYSNKDDASTLIRIVDDISAVKKYAEDSDNVRSTGGMKSKILAAESAQIGGVETNIANGQVEGAIKRAAFLHEIGTRFRLNRQTVKHL